MRSVTWTDHNGYLRRSLIKDTDSDNMAEYGIPDGPPDVDGVDWETVKREINNLLVENGFNTWKDLQRSQIGLNIVTSVLKRHLAQLYYEHRQTNWR